MSRQLKIKPAVPSGNTVLQITVENTHAVFAVIQPSRGHQLIKLFLAWRSRECRGSGSPDAHVECLKGQTSSGTVRLPGIESLALADLALSLPAAFLPAKVGLWWGFELKLLCLVLLCLCM